MTIGSPTPRAALTAIQELLDRCARVEAGQEVLLVAHLDGLCGSDNLVDREAISWIQTGVQVRGARASVLWIDEPGKAHEWRLPALVKAGMKAADVTILHSFDITFEEIVELKQFVYRENIRLVRNFATTAPLLCSAWARTPHELVSAIRYQAALMIAEGASWQLSDPNGTALEGKISSAYNENHPWFSRYAITREEGKGYLPWPEWVVTPIRLKGTNGEYVFECMFSWWSRYIGISPYFSRPIKLAIRDDKIARVEGGEEAEALRRFLEAMREKLGEGVYDFNCFHFGVHPQAEISPQECPNPLYRRMIEHGNSCNFHAHVGAPPPTKAYPYWLHCTADIRRPTFKVGDRLVQDKGYLTALDDPVVRAIAARYPEQPGLGKEPSRF
jgi:hypothetical protein